MQITKENYEQSSRQLLKNGYIEIKDNPISMEGVFEYSGAQISPELEPSRIYKVYRPASELSKQETIDSFKLVPWTDAHAMIGSAVNGMTPPEMAGIGGVVGEGVYFDQSDNKLKANLRVFSKKLTNIANYGTTELSIGYGCEYVYSPGIFNGIPYEYVQINILGNHLTSVPEGRCGKEVAVLDHLKFTFDQRVIKNMTQEKDTEVLDQEAPDATSAMGDLMAKFEKLEALVTQLMTPKDDDVDAEDEDVNVDDKDNEKMVAMDSKLKKVTSELESFKKDAFKQVMSEVSKRDALVSALKPVVGVFDSAAMTAREVASYAVKKMGLTCDAGEELATVNGFLSARNASVAEKTVAMDSVSDESNSVHAYLKKLSEGVK
jgi:hypothetical protein